MGLIERRIGLLFGVFLVLLAAIGLRAAWLTLVKGGSLSNAATAQQVHDAKVPARRGTITDRNGLELAVSETGGDVAATPYLVRDPVRVSQRLAPLLGKDPNELVRDLSRRDTGFVYLARQVPPGNVLRLEQLKKQLKIDGLDVEPAARRVYPQGMLAAQLLGAVGIDGDGLDGIEHAEDDVLRGADGERRVVRDALGQPISLRDVQASRSGAPIQLTIDGTIQERVEQVLEQVGREHHPKGATAIVTDPKTSEVLALANWPRVNANKLADSDENARQNRGAIAAYEPGSTFKPFTVAAALESGTVTPSSSFNLPPEIQVADRTIGESSPRDWVTLDTAGILAQSSNVGTITIAQRLGARRFSSWVDRFGFGSDTGTGLPGEAAGIVPALKDYSGSSIGNLPIGQGLAVTPLQMAAAYGAIANGGVLEPLRVVREVNGVAAPARRGRRIVSRATAAEVRRMLRGVVEEGGTAANVAISGYDVAGKTGTANKPDPETGGYSETRYVASFAGFIPARDPGVLITVMVDEPQGEVYGAQVAGPAFEQIARFIVPYLRIPPR